MNEAVTLIAFWILACNLLAYGLKLFSKLHFNAGTSQKAEWHAFATFSLCIGFGKYSTNATYNVLTELLHCTRNMKCKLPDLPFILETLPFLMQTLVLIRQHAVEQRHYQERLPPCVFVTLVQWKSQNANMLDQPRTEVFLMTPSFLQQRHRGSQAAEGQPDTVQRDSAPRRERRQFSGLRGGWGRTV